MPDHELLREYAERGAENSFRTLVERHGGMVYGVARRLSGNEHAAAEITQSVFLALARKSAGISRSVPLAGWLHTATRYAASHWHRSEARRREREKAASLEEVHAVNSDSERTWEEISPSLDAALASLNARDRDAVLLRFFEQRSFSEVAAELATTEDAAKMRVGRAVRKLRAFFHRHGTAVNAAALTTCLAGHAAATAPTHVVATAAQLAGSAATQGTMIAAMTRDIAEGLRWARIKQLLLAASAVIAVAAGVGLGLTAIRPTRDLTAPGAAESLLRDSTAISGAWRATPDGLAVDEMPWTHLALRGPFDGGYRLLVTYRQQNPAGAVELLLPAGPEMLLVVLRPVPAASDATIANLPLDAGRNEPPLPIEHVAEIEMRPTSPTDREIFLSVKLDGAVIAGPKDVPAALQLATMVPNHPRGELGLGTVRTAAVFTRLDVQPRGNEP